MIHTMCRKVVNIGVDFKRPSSNDLWFCVIHKEPLKFVFLKARKSDNVMFETTQNNGVYEDEKKEQTKINEQRRLI